MLGDLQKLGVKPLAVTVTVGNVDQSTRDCRPLLIRLLTLQQRPDKSSPLRGFPYTLIDKSQAEIEATVTGYLQQPPSSIHLGLTDVPDP